MTAVTAAALVEILGVISLCSCLAFSMVVDFPRQYMNRRWPFALVLRQKLLRKEY